MIIQSAFDRVIRTLIVSIGIGSVLFSLLGLPGIIEQYRFLDTSFAAVSIAVFCGLPPVMALIAFRAPIAVLRTLAAVHAASTLFFLVLWIPSMSAPSALTGGQLPWIINTVAVATSEAAIAFPLIAAWIYMLAITVISGFVRYVTYGSPDASQSIQDAIMILLLSGFMMSLIQLTLLAGREQDAAARTALDAAAASAAAETLERQRARFQSFTRDDVLATLQAASQNTPESREVARQGALLTLEKMSQFSDDSPPPAARIAVADLDVLLRTAAVTAGISYASSLSSPEGALEVPAEIGDAIADAMTEAMDNSNRHARWRDDRVVHRTVRAVRQGQAFSVVVKDDGRGFNPRRVGLDRLGLRLSILERVNSFPGASAAIASSRGRGTTVTLEWNETPNEK